jgi:hypothetical protein
MHGKPVRTVLAIALALIAGVTALPGQLSKQALEPDSAAKPKVILVELFTSEGCSSCPPADVLLQQINGTRTPAGQLIVGISEHVTYWNSLGWSDPFSSPNYTERQNAYGTRFGLDGVYTPQMVINGAEQIVGSDRAALERALKKEQDQPSLVLLHILATTLTKKSLVVNFSATGTAPMGRADIIAILADDADQSSVLRGENSGKILTHVAVARAISRVAMSQPATEQTVEIQLPSSFHELKGHHLVLFAQARGNGRIFGADTKPL